MYYACSHNRGFDIMFVNANVLTMVEYYVPSSRSIRESLCADRDTQASATSGLA